MATIIRLKKAKAEKLYECTKKVHKSAKKLFELVEELMDDEDFDERGGRGNGGGMAGGSGMGGGGNFRDDYDDDDYDDDDDDMDERRGVPGTGRYGRRRYRRK